MFILIYNPIVKYRETRQISGSHNRRFIMEGTMKTAVMLAARKMGFETRPIPQPKDNEVLVKIEHVGICGSDLHYYESGKTAYGDIDCPFVLGHECAGTVVELGRKVTRLKVGDRVALEPGTTCGECEFCKSGRYNLCPHVQFFATPPVDGVFQEYVAHEANMCFKLPDNVSTLEGALIEPLAVGFHAARQGGAELGKTALITGSGCIGLTTLLALHSLGVSEVYISDMLENRLDKARELGASLAINSKETDVVAKVMEMTDGRGVDIAIECSGVEVCANQAIDVLVKGGTLVQVAYARSGQMTLNTTLLCDKELNIKSVFRYRHIYPIAIKAVAEGKADIKSIVTDCFTLDDIQNAMDRSIQDKANIVKAVVKI